MKLKNKYGFVLLKNKKAILTTNSFGLVVMKLEKPEYYQCLNKLQIEEIKTKKQYNKLWKDCPFRQSF